MSDGKVRGDRATHRHCHAAEQRHADGIAGSTDDRRCRGVALLLVIWVLAVLATVAAAFAASMRSEARVAHNFVEVARARAFAEAGVSRAAAGLLAVDPRLRWRADGTPHELDFDGGAVRIRIEDEAGKIDLNKSAPELISGLCRELGLDSGVCAALVDGLEARRRLAPAPNPVLGDPRDRRRAADPLGPATMHLREAAAFAALGELRELPAVDAAALERLRPFLTVFSPSGRIDPEVAPREVLLAIPGVDPRAVEALLAARAATADQAMTVLPPLAGVDLFVAAGQLRVATVIAEARTESGASFARRAVLAMTRSPLHPVQVVEWRQDLGSADWHQDVGSADGADNPASAAPAPLAAVPIGP